MRPVNKGKAPRRYTVYQDALDDLRGRIGDYCSYCERWIETDLAVEHVLPKQVEGKTIEERLLSWENFLLACRNCNSCKGDRPVRLRDYLWPHRDNTFHALTYDRDGLVKPNPDCRPSVQKRATATIHLLGLDVQPGSSDPEQRRQSKRDRRFLRRLKAYERAMEMKLRLKKMNSLEMRDTIVLLAVQTGHFSIWMTVFEDDHAMCRALVAAFPGTDLGRPLPLVRSVASKRRAAREHV